MRRAVVECELQAVGGAVRGARCAVLQIVWDAEHKRWRNLDGDEDEAARPPPPPPRPALAPAHQP